MYHLAVSQLRASTQAPKSTNGRRSRVLKRAQRLRKLGYATYDEYLSSPHWLRLRELYRHSGRPQACICGEAESLHLHHITYDRVGAEELTDLIALCPGCHTAIHELERRGEISLDPADLTSADRAAQYAAAAQRHPEPEPEPRPEFADLPARLQNLLDAQARGVDVSRQLASIRQRIEAAERQVKAALALA